MAIWRCAVCDYIGVREGTDEADRTRRIGGGLATEGGTDLTSDRATELADMAGFRAELVWRQAQATRGPSETQAPSVDDRLIAA